MRTDGAAMAFADAGPFLSLYLTIAVIVLLLGFGFRSIGLAAQWVDSDDQHTRQVSALADCPRLRKSTP
jgi:hypothetical protein